MVIKLINSAAEAGNYLISNRLFDLKVGGVTVIF